MNIFVSSFDPVESAQVLDNSRLIKMILESAQILSTVLHLNNIKSPYKPTHKNHPVVKWTNESSENYWWLLEHFQALCHEYEDRFHKTHKSSQYHDNFVDGYFQLNLTNDMTPFVNCTKFSNIKEITQAYRLALIDKWNNDKRPPKWTNCSPPEWYR